MGTVGDALHRRCVEGHHGYSTHSAIAYMVFFSSRHAGYVGTPDGGSLQ